MATKLECPGFPRFPAPYRDAINLESGYKFNPKGRGLLGGLYQWHHHEVPGVMLLIPALIHRISHFGGVFYCEISYGEKYKNSTAGKKKK